MRLNLLQMAGALMCGLKAATKEFVPAIALSAMAGRENWVRALTSGFNTHIAKPADPEELVRLIYRFTTERSDEASFK